MNKILSNVLTGHIVLFGEDDDGNLWDVHDGDVQRGKACNLHCLACGGPLIAKQGEIIRWHFAHASGVACAGSGESAIHKLAKEAIAEAGGIRIPELVVEYMGLTQIVCEGTWVQLDDIRIEEWQDSLRPDLVGAMRDPDADGELHIEILWTHAVDQRKTAIIRERDMATIEIYLSKSLRPRPGITDWTEGDSGLGVGAVVLRDDRPRADP